MGRKKPTLREEDGVAAGGGKSKKKGFQIDDDEYSVGTELSEDATFQKEKVEPVANKKKGKKGGSKKMEIKDGDEEFEDNKIEEDDDDNDALAVKFTGKKKGKGKKGVFTASSFGLLGEEDNDDDNDGGQKDEEKNSDDVIEFKGKKPSKSKKGGSGSLFSSSAFDALSDDEDGDSGVVDDNEDAPVISFSGKKNPSKSKKSGGVSTADFDVLDGEEEDNDKDDQDEDMPSIKFSGKKKSSKKKKSSALEDGNNNESSEFVVPEQDVINKKMNEPVAETTSKNKKKKKKGVKAGQEEDDLDKILAEIGGTAPIAPPIAETVQNQLAVDEAAGEKEAEVADESVTSKKKEKKKDKEKEKKAAAAGPSMEEKQDETKTDVKSKVLDKKVPKAVREMQERLAKLKEAEEKKKREEEERIRKEEEERLRLEELERQEAEKKRLKKEREKEKLLKKKQEGKLLTGKQKEEAKRLEAFRNQLLANAGGLQLNAGGLQLNAGDSSKSATKKPLYQKKKLKPQAQSNGAAPAEVEGTYSKAEAEMVEEVESSSGRDKSEVTDEVEENGIEEVKEEEEDDDEEWDAKSWDKADLKLPGRSAFSDEEVESEPEPLAKELKTTKTATQDVHPRSDAESADITVKKATVNRDNKNKKEIIAKGDMTKNIESVQDLRSPICCIMGHVDTGKTKLLDCIRGTDVQGGEAGGITQQIGATYFPAQNIRDRTKELKHDAKLNVPGLLVIDTPGHESFTNLRSRGSGLCDIAILVVDIMHGLEPQTIESLNLLKMRNTEFIVALNKVDRLYGWKTCKNAPIMKAMKQQTKDVQNEFNQRLIHVITQFKEQGLNTELYYKNKEMGETFSIVPTSAISGEGIPDLLLLLVQWTQKTMIERLTFSNEVQCTVLEVKVIEGHGTTIDVVLVNGVLHEGDQIVVCGLQGPIVTSIRALLTPHPMKELRVKGTYLHHKEIKAAQGIKITAQGLEHAIAGTSLYVVGPDDDLEDIKDSTMEDMKSVMSRIDKSGVGVYVQASTLGSLEALLEFLKSPAVSIPVSAISIGPVHKKDVMKASVMLEKNKEYATILAFDVRVTPEARELADELGVKIFIADIIYHLFDQFKAYIDNIKEVKKKEASDEAVFPCVLKIMPNCVFNKKDPIVLGVDVLEGTAKIGTPICVPQREFTEIGRIASIENNHKPVDFAKKGQKVAIKIIGSNPDEQQKMFGRHFEMEDELVSKITRSSLDALKEHYAEEISKEEKALLFKLKKLFNIP